MGRESRLVAQLLTLGLALVSPPGALGAAAPGPGPGPAPAPAPAAAPAPVRGFAFAPGSGSPSLPKPPVFIGGVPTRVDKFPFMVALHVYDKHLCAGTALTRRWVLSAAHCFYDTKFHALWPLATLSVLAGASSSEAAAAGEGAQWRKVASVSLAPGHLEPSLAGHAGVDIGAAKLKTRLQWTAWVQPVPLHFPVGIFSVRGLHLTDEEIRRDKYFPAPKTTCVTLGWGTVRGGRIKLSDLNASTRGNLVLKSAPMGVVSYVECRDNHPQVFRFSHVCATGTEIGQVCNSDAGSPLMCGGRQVALASVIDVSSCWSQRVPQVFARVGPNIRWLVAITDPSGALARSLWGRGAEPPARPRAAPGRALAQAAAAAAALPLLLAALWAPRLPAAHRPRRA